MLGLTLTFAGIEAELRAVQQSKGKKVALGWWERKFAHKYPLYEYDVNKKEVVRRNESR